MRIYMDLCAWKRPYDAPANERVTLESLAVAALVREAEVGRLEIVSSTVLEFENSKNPDVERRREVAGYLRRVKVVLPAAKASFLRARGLQRLGVKPIDVLHLAVAEEGRCDSFVTCDDRLQAAGLRAVATLRLRIADPLAVLAEMKGAR